MFMLDAQGRLPKVKPALLADAIATTVGAVLGTGKAKKITPLMYILAVLFVLKYIFL